MIPTALALDAEPPPEALASADDLPRLYIRLDAEGAAPILAKLDAWAVGKR